MFSFYGWCVGHKCKEEASVRAQIDIGALTMLVPLCPACMAELQTGVDDLEGHDLAVIRSK